MYYTNSVISIKSLFFTLLPLIGSVFDNQKNQHRFYIFGINDLSAGKPQNHGNDVRKLMLHGEVFKHLFLFQNIFDKFFKLSYLSLFMAELEERGIIDYRLQQTSSQPAVTGVLASTPCSLSSSTRGMVLSCCSMPSTVTRISPFPGRCNQAVRLDGLSQQAVDFKQQTFILG